MKKKFTALLCHVLLFCLVFPAVFSSCASAETLGFGIVNASDVAIRKDAAGKRITRLPEGTCVWITGSKSDSAGNLWYHVLAQDNSADRHPVYDGWMKAEFVDAGSRLWHDIRAVKASAYAMIVLKNDGTVACAGDWTYCDPKDQYTGLRDIRQIGLVTIGCGFYAVDGNGRLYRNGEPAGIADRIRLAGSLDLICITEDNRLLGTYGAGTGIGWIYPRDSAEVSLEHVTAMAEYDFRYLFLTDDGTVYSAYRDDPALDYPEPDWASWTDVAGIDVSCCSFGTEMFNGRMHTKYVPAFAAVRKDGTVLAAPEELAALTAGWQGIRKVAVGSYWVLGLKQDGTVVTAGIAGNTPPDVSSWTDITDISNGHTYCVGLKQDGTLVFAGNYHFNED